MPTLTVENLTTGVFVIQDPTGLYGFNMDVAASDTESVDLSDAAFAAIESLLDDAKTAGQIAWTVADDPDALADNVPRNLRTALVTPVTVVAGEEIIKVVLTAPGAVAVALPADAQVGAEVTVIDGTGDANSNNITVAQAGGTINGVATSVIGTDDGSRTFIKTGALTWSAITTAAAAPAGVAGGDLDGSYPTPVIKAGALAATTTGRAMVAADFFNSATLINKIGTGELDAAAFEDIFGVGALAASANARAKMAADFFDSATLIAKIATGALDAAAFADIFGAGAIAASADARAKMAAGFFDSATLIDKIGTGELDAAAFADIFGVGAIAASADARAKFAADFFDSATLIDKIVTGGLDAAAFADIFGVGAIAASADARAKFAADFFDTATLISKIATSAMDATAVLDIFATNSIDATNAAAIIADDALTVAKLGSDALYGNDLQQPDALADDRFLLSVIMQATAYALDETTLPADNPPRNVIITHTTDSTTDTLGNAVVDGTDFEDSVIQETLAVAADGVVTGTKAFKTVTQVVTAGWAQAGGVSDLIEVGFGNVLGLAYRLANAEEVFLTTLDGVALSPDAVAVNAADLEENTVDMNSGTYDGTKLARVLLRKP